MRKGQVKILSQAREGGLPEGFIRFLGDSAETLDVLRDMLRFFLAHRDDCGGYGPEAFLTALDFIRQAPYMDGEGAWAGGMGVYQFWSCSIGVLLDWRKKQGMGLYTQGDIMALGRLASPFPVCIPASDAEYIVARRKGMAENRRGLLPDSFAIDNIYKNRRLAKASLYEKTQFEACLAADPGFDAGHADASAVTRLYGKWMVDRNFPGLYGLCFPANGGGQPANWKAYLWETEKMDMLYEMAQRCAAPLSITISGSPYAIGASMSATGVSIHCETYSGYALHKSCYDGHDHISIGKSDKTASKCSLLFLFNGDCYIQKGHIKKWRPATLSDLSAAYRGNGTMAEIIDAYIGKFIREGAYVWKDLKALLATGRVAPLVVNRIKGFRTKQDMMASYYKGAGFYNWNRKDLYSGYIAMKAMPYVKEEDRNILVDYVNKLGGGLDGPHYLPGANTKASARYLLGDVILSRLQGKQGDEAYDVNNPHL